MPEYEKNTLKQNSHFHKAINHIAVVDDNHSFYNCAIIMGVGIIRDWPLPVFTAKTLYVRQVMPAVH